MITPISTLRGKMSKVFFETHGCSTNQAEEEVMAGLLKKEGHKIVKSQDDADLIVLNMCSVKGLTVTKKAINKINEHIEQNPHKKMILAGCIPRDEYKELREILPNASFLHTDNMMQISEVANETLNNNIVDLMTPNKGIKIGFSRVRRNPFIAILPINEGCEDSCTYCSTKRIKGKTISYPMRTITKEIEDAVNDGCKEIWITSQDTCAYGLDQQEKSLLPELLKMILALDKQFMMRIGMLNPSNLLPVLDEFLEVMEDKRMYKFLHIPVQAGDNKVLEAMKRRYKKEDIELIVKKFKQKFPEGTISTDIIVGFPGETEEQFENTMDLVRNVKFETVNISRYQDRQGTMSWRMDSTVKLGDNIKSDRSNILTDTNRRISMMNNESWLGWEGPILITEKKKDLIGRNFAYKLIVLKKPDEMREEEYNNLLGKAVKVKIVKAETFYCVGELISK